jgi:elongation factor P--(R)-beta-lysine ligase
MVTNSANKNILLAKAKLLKQIREFFALKNVLEVETPLLCKTTITAPYLHSFTTKYKIQNKFETLYLQTSPEFAMKKLLANFRCDIYQICKAFRDEEFGRMHNFEFTILEWYRINFDHHQLMAEMNELIKLILNTNDAEKFSYEELFLKYLNINPHLASAAELKNCAHQNNLPEITGIDENDKDLWLQLLLSNFIEPHLGQNNIPTFIYDYPASQAALAKLRTPKVAERFELYFKGIELANGFHELTDANEQRQRFIEDNIKRKQLNLPEVPLDEELLKVLPKIPNCSGVALGIDRLLMFLIKANTIQNLWAK